MPAHDNTTPDNEPGGGGLSSLDTPEQAATVADTTVAGSYHYSAGWHDRVQHEHEHEHESKFATGHERCTTNAGGAVTHPQQLRPDTYPRAHESGGGGERGESSDSPLPDTDAGDNVSGGGGTSGEQVVTSPARLASEGGKSRNSLRRTVLLT